MNTDKKIIQLLETQPFLRGMSERYLPMIADCAELKSFKEGDCLMQQNRPAQLFYLVLKGRVSLCAKFPSKGIFPVDAVSAPAALGWSWLVEPYKWHYDAKAVEDTDTILVHTPCILGKIENDKEFGFEIYQCFTELIVDRLHGTQMQMMDIYAKPEQELL